MPLYKAVALSPGLPLFWVSLGTRVIKQLVSTADFLGDRLLNGKLAVSDPLEDNCHIFVTFSEIDFLTELWNVTLAHIPD